MLIISYFLANIYEKNTSNKGEKYNNHLLIVFLNYIGQSLCIFIQIIMNKCVFNNISNKNGKKNNIKSHFTIKNIFNDQSEQIKNKDFIIFFLF